MEAKILPRPKFVAPWAVLLFLLAGFIYLFALQWPILCLFSDFKALLADQNDGRHLPTWRLVFSLFASSALTGAIWLGFRRYRASGRAVLPVVTVCLLLAGFVFFPDLREAVLVRALPSGPTTLIVEAVAVPDSYRSVRLVLGSFPDASKLEDGIVWFADADECHVDLPDKFVKKLAKESGFLELPPDLEPEGALAHDWLRVTFAAGPVELNVLGLQRSGRQSARLGRVVRTILQGVRGRGVESHSCVDRLERLLETLQIGDLQRLELREPKLGK